MRNLLWLAALGSAALAGCANMPPGSHPGTAQYQRSMAERFDPYPENEPGPAIVGGRPMEFEKPIPETQRARWSPYPLR